MRWFISLILLLLMSCSNEGVVSRMEGRFVFGGQGISLLDLRSGEAISIKQTPTRLVKSIDLLPHGKFLVSISELKPAINRNQIEIWSADDDTIYSLGAGSHAVSFSEYNKIVYYNSSGDLTIGQLSGIKANDHVILSDGKLQNYPVLKTGNNTFLYPSGNTDRYEVSQYSLTTGLSKRMPQFDQCSFSNSFWLEEKHSLLCQEQTSDGIVTGNYFIINLKGQKTPVDFSLEGSWPIGVVDNGTKILLQESTTENFFTKEVYRLWCFNLQTNHLEKVHQHFYAPTVMKQLVNIQ